MNRRLALPLAALLAAAAAQACSGSSGPAIPDQAVISLDPPELPDGGAVALPDPPGLNTVQTFTWKVTNGGRATLTLTSVKMTLLDGGAPGASFPLSQPLVAVDGGTAQVPPASVQVPGAGPAANNSAFLQFTYSPKLAGRTNAVLAIDSDAPARPHVALPLTVCAARLADGGC